MKTKIVLGLALCLILTSCATVFAPRATEYQKTKPSPGQPSRQVYVGYLIADILLFPLGLIPDFATGKIYKPK